VRTMTTSGALKPACLLRNLLRSTSLALSAAAVLISQVRTEGGQS
jgi:hypothetical protein